MPSNRTASGSQTIEAVAFLLMLTAAPDDKRVTGGDKRRRQGEICIAVALQLWQGRHRTTDNGQTAHGKQQSR